MFCRLTRDKDTVLRMCVDWLDKMNVDLHEEGHSRQESLFCYAGNCNAKKRGTKYDNNRQLKLLPLSKKSD